MKMSRAVENFALGVLRERVEVRRSGPPRRRLVVLRLAGFAVHRGEIAAVRVSAGRNCGGARQAGRNCGGARRAGSRHDGKQKASRDAVRDLDELDSLEQPSASLLRTLTRASGTQLTLQWRRSPPAASSAGLGSPAAIGAVAAAGVAAITRARSTPSWAVAAG